MTIEDATIMVIFGCFDLLIFLVMIYVAVSIIKWFFGLFSSGSGSYRLSQGASEPDTYDYDPEKERRNRQEQEAWEEKLRRERWKDEEKERDRREDEERRQDAIDREDARRERQEKEDSEYYDMKRQEDDDRLREEWEANQRRKLGYDDDD
ncbi:MAG: hypothetical protein HYZ22_04655 [Chloroflexi bacterium]|nr:hypothetical protein [Chloroflexota bacterium]